MKADTVALIMTKKCNLKCSYCYEGENKEDGKMSLEVAKKAISFLHPKEIVFFGGEPLLEKDLIYEIIDYGQYNGVIIFSFTTNATLLDEEFINEILRRNVFYGFLISIDGQKEIHNKHRGEFDKTLEGIKLLKKYHVPLEARITLTPDTIGDLFNSVKYLFEIGFKEIAFLPADSGKFGYSETDYFNYVVQLVKIINWWHDTYKPPKLKFIKDYLNPKYSPCGFGNSYMAVDEKGDIYPCHRFCFIPQSVLGSVWAGLDDKKTAFYKTFNRNDLIGCLNCKANKFCMGICPAANYFKTGHSLVPDDTYCDLKKCELSVINNYMNKLLTNFKEGLLYLTTVT